MTYSVGDLILVPSSVVGKTDAPTAILELKVLKVGAGGATTNQRSVQVDVDGTPEWVSTARAHHRMGIYLIRIGDLSTEMALLDPVAKSLSHFFRLLVGDGIFHVVYLRTFSELTHFWKVNSGNVTHLLLLGHGRADAIRFMSGDATGGADHWVRGDELASAIESSPPPQPIHILSFGCSTGRAAFSRDLSVTASCDDFAAPFNDIHGAIASQFVQALFVEVLLHGRTWGVAFRRARKATLGSAEFRVWENGTLVKRN